MGFRPKKRTQTVTMTEDSEWYGLEAELVPMDFGMWLELTNSGADGLSMLDVIHSVEKMSCSLISWNLEDPDSGEPVPIDQATIMKQDRDMLMALTGRWVNATTGVSDPLPETSSDTAPLPEVFLPTEDLSLPPESSDVPV
jgi:hypothetical protein